MAITNGYATRDDLKTRMGATVSTWDAIIDEAVECASREIDRHCTRRFYLDNAVSARVYYPLISTLTFVDDIGDLAGIIVATDLDDDGVYETIWTSVDYQLEPLNGVVEGESGFPRWWIKAVKSNRFPVPWDPAASRAPVQVTAKWGWAAVPSPVHQACMIIAEANFAMKDAKFGVAGFDGFGAVRVRDNPMAEAKLRKYVRESVRVA